MTSLLLMLITTLIAMAMFRGFGMRERIAGTMREKHRATQAAETAQMFAERWLITGNNAASSPVVCVATLNANLGQGQICSNSLATAAGGAVSVPWTGATGPLGTSYAPPGMVVAASAAIGTYARAPQFFIQAAGPSASGNGTVFRIDAAGFGGTDSAVAVVESTYEVSSGVVDRGGL
ncbi:MAG: pilus assembly protein PilX [Gammaproteobacteria bacterium]|nr:pilus assembly protein PilX [Gammaproteobacteria bacterium]